MEDVKFGTSRDECAASGVDVPIDTHIQGSPNGAHSFALHDSLEDIIDHEECIGDGGGEQEATLKIDTIMASPGDSCASCPVKLESAQSQGIADDSGNISTIENERENEHKGKIGPFKNTTNNTELKRESHSGSSEVNGNDVYLERMSTGLTDTYSRVTAQTENKIQSCLKKSELPVKKRVSFKTGHHSTETRQTEHRCDIGSLAMKGSIRHPVIAKLGRKVKLELERISLPLKGECHNATSVGAKLSNRDVQRTVKTKKSVLDTGDIRSSKRYKTVSLISNKNVFTENRSIMKRNRHSKSKRRKSAPVIKRNKQFSEVCDCEVKLERLSPEFLRRALSGQKKQQSVETRSMTRVHQRHKTGNSFYFQKPEDTNNGTKEKTDGSFKMEIIDDTWGSDRIDAWGNVRYLLKGHSNLSECEEDWYGWWVRVDSLHKFCDAHLYSISDGVTDSRIMVWDNTFEAKPAPQNNTVRVPEQAEYAHEESQDTDEDWAGWKVLCIEKSVADVDSFGFSDEEAGDFYGW
ncbi:hypothetical protein B7P43_G17434 [Cryptotermes secundus]|nr:hypothetical protein B7P43_G17434 [Cryptotermes secundus]